jgi:hypothetical protein
MDPRLVDVVERMLDRCGRGQQVQGNVIAGCIWRRAATCQGNAASSLLRSVAECEWDRHSVLMITTQALLIQQQQLGVALRTLSSQPGIVGYITAHTAALNILGLYQPVYPPPCVPQRHASQQSMPC